jgi:hypothetical protein
MRVAYALTAQCQEEGGGGAGVQGDLEGLAQVRREGGVAGGARRVPPKQVRQQRDVTRARYRQQLRRALDGAQQERLVQRQPQADSVAGSPPLASASRLRRRFRTIR